MIGTGIDVRVKIQDIVTSQLPEFILSEAPLTDDFLKQFYVSQEFQGGTIDFASNLDQYLDLNNLSSDEIYGEYELRQDIDSEDDVVYVNTTKGFPQEWGLLKVDDEIMTYTGVTTNSFTGVVRGFSAIESLHSEGSPNEIVFSTTEAASHLSEATVTNLSVVFLKEFFNKLKYTFAPGFEDLEVDSDLDIGNWIRQVRSFFQTKGSEESIIILFKVLYGEKPTVVDLEQFLIKPSEAEYSRRDYAVATPIEGNPLDLEGRSIFEVGNPTVFGAISEIEPFTRDGKLYYKIYFFVSNDEIGNEKKLFAVPGKSYAHRGWNPGDTTLTVDTTIGFRNNGQFVTEDGTVFNYEQRTINQFLGVTCDDPTKTILVKDEILDNIVVSGTTSDGDTVTMRLTGVISDINFGEELPFNFVGEKIRVDTLGENILSDIAKRDESTIPEIIANSFVYNTSVRFEVRGVNGTEFEIEAKYLDKAFIAPGDRVDILQRGSQIVYASNRLVTNVDFINSTLTIDDSFGVPIDELLDIRRIQKYANSTGAPIDYGNNSVLTNILNLYDATEYDSNFYVATNSFPSYEITANIVESSLTDPAPTAFEDFNSFTGEYSIIVFDQKVNFYTGDLVTYSVSEGTTPFVELGEYYVQVLSDRRKIKLFVSPSFIGSENNVGVVPTGEPGSHFFTLERQKTRQLTTKRVFRKIPVSNDLTAIDRLPEPTEPGAIAILTNGVEIVSYKSPNKVFLGPLKELDAVSKGEGYSVISPPEIYIADPDVQLFEGGSGTVVPTTASGTAVVKGKLQEILIDPQDFEIDEVFSITVRGGNSSGATADPIIDTRNRTIPFDTRITQLGGGVNPDDNSILFQSPHNLANGAAVIYNNKGTESIGVALTSANNISQGTTLSNGGTYYAKIINNKTIQLFDSLSILESGGDPVFLSSNLTGFGIQSFDTPRTNRLIGATISDDGGDFIYRNMKFLPDNVFVEYDEIRYVNHGFESGDIVDYGTTGINIGGMSTDHQYYIYKVDENTIKLSDAGIGATISSNYERLEFVNFTDVGVGTHNIKYPDISAEIVVSFASSISGDIVATPIIRGSIEQVYTDDGGYYGSDILNFEKSPEVYPITGSLAALSPSVVDGQINSVQIINSGKNYSESPDLIVTDLNGGGIGAKLRAVVDDGQIKDVVIIEPGISYSESGTRIEVVDPGKDALIIPRIRDLTINLNARFGFEILNQNNYRVVSYERTLREEVYNDVGNFHSPIVGWANDGNPIYGGFGFSDPQNTNSAIRAMKTAYELVPEDVFGRPSQQAYPAGFFIEDYKYTDNGDLDQYNGRYCRTPEFPDGVYAYFAGISTDPQSSAKEPQFPYFIGPEFRDSPIDPASTNVDQDFDLTDKPIYRNTFPYFVGNPTCGSEFLDQSYLFDIQDTIVESIAPGTIDGIEIVGVGKSYAVGDLPIFQNEEDSISSTISQVTGVGVSEIVENTLSYSKLDTKAIRIDQKTVRIYVYPNHDYIQNDTVIISGLSTNAATLGGSRIVNTDNSAMTLYSPVEPIINDGIADIFVNSISSNVSVGSSIIIGEGAQQETVRVLNIFPVNKALRVYRPVSFPFTAEIGQPVTPIPNYFDVNIRTPEFDSRLDEVYYFNPKQTVSIEPTLGDSTDRVYSIGNIQYNISVPAGTIYAPNHGFENLEEVTLTKPQGSLSFSALDELGNTVTIPLTGDSINLYVHVISKDLIGLRPDPNTTDYIFVSDASDLFEYSISSNRFAESVNLDRIRAKVTTIEPHNLQNGDTVTLNVAPFGPSGIGQNETIKLEFDEVSQSLVIDPYFVDSADVNPTTNLIFIQNHRYVLGDYILYETSGTEIAGLTANTKYFIIPFDTDRFYLAKTLIDTQIGSQLPVNLFSSGSGTHKFSKVNPKISMINNHDIVFDISDPSLAGREVKFFYDQQLTEIFENNGVDNEFVVIDSGTTKTIKYSKNNPAVIYYGIESGGFISTTDTNAIAYNSISYIDSTYSLKGTVTADTDNEFSLSLPEKPEVSTYTPQEAVLSYLTSSKNTLGGVGEVRIISAGKNFQTLPEFITVQSQFGNNASLRATSNGIGRLSSFRIQNPGWNYSADSTIAPKGIIQPSIEFTNSDFVTDIEVLDGGIGYQTPPNGVLIDSVTREEVNSGSILVEIQSSKVVEVVLDVAPSGLSKNPHEFFTTNNSNGVPIAKITNYDDVTNSVTFTLQTPIAGYLTAPFEVGDKVFVENIFDNDAANLQSNLNSSDYGYSFFEVTQVISSNPVTIVVQYPEDGPQINETYAENQNSFSTIVNTKIYPQFKVNQTTAVFVVGERLSLIDNGVITPTDLVIEESNTNYFKVSGNFDLLVGDNVRGNISGIEVTVTSLDTTSCRYEVDTTSRLTLGWNNSIGFINDEFQVTPDNDYYQNLSYSIKSTINFEELIGPVNRLVHPAGLKNFSDTKIESSAKVGFGTTSIDTDSSITLDFIGLTDIAETPLRVDRINTFDLGYDTNVVGNKSNAIRFNSFTPEKRLTDYVEVKTNRVLLADDISNLFIDSDNLSNQDNFIDFNVITDVFTKGILHVRNPITDQVQLTEIVSLSYDNRAFTMEKATVFDGEESYGTFEAMALTSNSYTLRFVPEDPFTFDADLKLLAQKFDLNSDAAEQLGYVDLGGDTATVPEQTTTQIYADVTDAVVLQVFVQEQTPDALPLYFEVYAFSLGTDVYFSTYGFDGLPIIDTNSIGYDFVARTNGSTIAIDIINPNSYSLVTKTKSTKFKPNFSGTSPYRFNRPTDPPGSERDINLISTQETGSTANASIDVITLDATLFQTAKVIVHISGNNIGAIHQVMIANSNGDTFTNTYAFITEGDGSGGSGIGTFGSEIVGNDWNLKFYPDSSFGAQPLTITAYTEAFYRDFDEVNYVDLPLTYQNNEEQYLIATYNSSLGSRANRLGFPIKYQGIPVYEKKFNPSSTINQTNNQFVINDHFFSDIEELYYEPGDSFNGTALPIEIAPTIDYEGNNVTTMPSKVWAVKFSLSTFGVASTRANAEAGILIDIIGNGAGNAHKIGMAKKLEKSLFTIDGVVQSPISKTNLTYTLDANIDEDLDFIPLVGISTIVGGDILLVDEEYIIVKNVGFATAIEGPITNSGSFALIEAERGTLGSSATSHTSGSEMDLYQGGYNIVGSELIFTEAPNGRGPQALNENNLVVTNSTFQGRVFLQQNYDETAVFDTISYQFDGTTNQFPLTSAGVAVSGVENGGGVLIINDIYQTPTTDNNQGNNYFFTNAQATFGYRWSDATNTTTAQQGEIRITGSGINVGLADTDANGLDRADYLSTLVGGDSYDVVVSWATSSLTYRGVKEEPRNGTRTFISGSIIEGSRPDSSVVGEVVNVTVIPNNPVSSVVFTGIRDVNGNRVESEFDVNQNQIPRGGLIVSLGSTPGLGYAPLTQAILDAEVSGGSIVGVYTGDTIGVTTAVKWADYNNLTGELVITSYGPAVTPQEFVGGSTIYFKESGRLLVDTPTSLASRGLEAGDIVVLDSLRFTCPGGSGITTDTFPDRNNAFVVDDIITDNLFAINVGISTIDHTYVSGGTWQKVSVFEYGKEGLNPSFVYLDKLEFACPSGQTAGLTTTLFPVESGAYPLITRDDDVHWRIQVGVSTLVHNYVGGGTIGQITRNTVGSGYNSVVAIAVTEAGHTGTAASIRGIPGPGGELQIVIDDPGSGYTDPYIFAPSPTYFNLPIEGISRRDGTTETGENLFVTVEVGGATTTAIGRSDYFEVKNFEITNQGFGFREGDVFTVSGIVTDKRLPQPLENFELTVLETFTDNFSYWNYGEQDYIDSIADLQDGTRTRFPLIYNGEQLSFEKNINNEDSGAIDLDSVLLIYLNTVLQVPGVSYTFDGGTSFEFTRAPLPEDDIDIYFYRGRRDIDSNLVTSSNETVRPGDEVQIRKNDVYDPSKTQDIRVVSEIASSDTIITNIYEGNNDIDEVNPRPVAWDKQKRDIFIYGQPIYKTRDSLESTIKPTASIIKRDFSSIESIIYVDDARMFRYESDTAVAAGGNIEEEIGLTIYGQDDIFVDWSFIQDNPGFTTAILTAEVNSSGQVVDINEINSGSGYPADTMITIAPPPDGVRAIPTYTWSTNDGELQFINVSFGNRGSGYDQSNPPTVLVGQPPVRYESDITVSSARIAGYDAVITSIVGTDNGPPGVDGQIEFSIFKTTPGGTVDDLIIGDYIVISNTSVGPGNIEAVGNAGNDLVGFGTQFFNCVYKVANFSSSSQEEAVVTVNVENDVDGLSFTGINLGNLSWGRISSVARKGEPKSFKTYDPTYTEDMRNYPTIVRSMGGLRDAGGIAKRVSGD